MENSFENGQVILIHTSYFHIDGEHYFGIYGVANLNELHSSNATPMIRMNGNVYGDDLHVFIYVSAISGISLIKHPEILASSKILKLQIDE